MKVNLDPHLTLDQLQKSWSDPEGSRIRVKYQIISVSLFLPKTLCCLFEDLYIRQYISKKIIYPLTPWIHEPFSPTELKKNP